MTNTVSGSVMFGSLVTMFETPLLVVALSNGLGFGVFGGVTKFFHEVLGCESCRCGFSEEVDCAPFLWWWDRVWCICQVWTVSCTCFVHTTRYNLTVYIRFSTVFVALFRFWLYHKQYGLQDLFYFAKNPGFNEHKSNITPFGHFCVNNTVLIVYCKENTSDGKRASSLFLRLNLTKMGYYIRGSCILTRRSFGLHLGHTTAVCGLGIENIGGLEPYEY